MLEKLFPQWRGKTLVLILLGFATTDFVITMTLSSADAAAHFVQNPFSPPAMKSQMGITLLLLVILGAIFLKGFKEAIRVAVVLVFSYLILSAVITAVGLEQVFAHPEVFTRWHQRIFAEHGSALAMFGICLLLFPKLALGLSGFETGVAVMPLIEGEGLPERIRNTRKLLLTAALIMSVFLIATSVVTTLLIPAEKFKEGGEANGRALAYLAHHYLGNVFGSVYDLSTILILAFAGASAMAGLLNLIPRYLPRFGMAPEWARGARPLVLVFLAISIIVTLLFHADVDAQGGAYATGVLVLITSAALAVTVQLRNSALRWPFSLITLIFIYTTALNAYERPDGMKIASVFIIAIVFFSLTSRALRSTELRVTSIEMDDGAKALLAGNDGQIVRLIARKPRVETEESLDRAARWVRNNHNIGEDAPIFFLEVEREDASSFECTLKLAGERVGKHCILRGRSPVVANSIAAALMHLETVTGKVPHGYFEWTEGNPIGNLVRFIFFGEGDVAPLVHEVLRRAIAEPNRRPVVHVS